MAEDAKSRHTPGEAPDKVMEELAQIRTNTDEGDTQRSEKDDLLMFDVDWQDPRNVAAHGSASAQRSGLEDSYGWPEAFDSPYLKVFERLLLYIFPIQILDADWDPSSPSDRAYRSSVPLSSVLEKIVRAAALRVARNEDEDWTEREHGRIGWRLDFDDLCREWTELVAQNHAVNPNGTRIHDTSSRHGRTSHEQWHTGVMIQVLGTLIRGLVIGMAMSGSDTMTKRDMDIEGVETIGKVVRQLALTEDGLRSMLAPLDPAMWSILKPVGKTVSEFLLESSERPDDNE